MYLLCIICFILYKQSLQWRLQACVGSVCVGGTALMCRGRECARLGSATRRVSFFVSLVGGGLRLSRPSSGSNGSVRLYRRVIFGNYQADLIDKVTVALVHTEDLAAVASILSAVVPALSDSVVRKVVVHGGPWKQDVLPLAWELFFDYLFSCQDPELKLPVEN